MSYRLNTFPEVYNVLYDYNAISKKFYRDVNVYTTQLVLKIQMKVNYLNATLRLLPSHILLTSDPLTVLSTLNFSPTSILALSTL